MCMSIHRCTCLDMHRLFLEKRGRGWCRLLPLEARLASLEGKQLITSFHFNQVCYCFFPLQEIWVLLILFCLGRQILTVTKRNGGAIQSLCPPRASHNFWFTRRLNTNEERSQGAGCLAANMTGDVASASLSSTTSSPSLLSLMARSPACNWG